jgi:hypothetical protein
MKRTFVVLLLVAGLFAVASATVGVVARHVSPRMTADGVPPPPPTPWLTADGVPPPPPFPPKPPAVTV